MVLAYAPSVKIANTADDRYKLRKCYFVRVDLRQWQERLNVLEFCFSWRQMDKSKEHFSHDFVLQIQEIRKANLLWHVNREMISRYFHSNQRFNLS